MITFSRHLRQWQPGQDLRGRIGRQLQGRTRARATLSKDAAAVSRGFYPPPSPAVLRRSLILSAAASSLGSIFFTIIQGTIFNFFLEDLSLRERLPYFMGLWCVASLGNLAGSWIQGRWGCRRGLFMWGIGGSRVIWLVIGLIPILRPEWLAPGVAFKWLSVLTVIFYFIHATGSTAWLSWMADLVPLRVQGRYWSLRQVGCSATSVLARLVSGYYLDAHHNMSGYSAIFICAAVLGIIDALTFFGVEHRQPKLRDRRVNVFAEFAGRLKDTPFRRLCTVYLLWSVSNCLMGPTCYYFMRDHVGMGVTSFSVVEAIGLVGYTAFSFLWGRHSDYHGHRGPLVLCLLLHAACPICYFFAGPQAVSWSRWAGASARSVFAASTCSCARWSSSTRAARAAGAGGKSGLRPSTWSWGWLISWPSRW